MAVRPRRDQFCNWSEDSNETASTGHADSKKFDANSNGVGFEIHLEQTVNLFLAPDPGLDRFQRLRTYRDAFDAEFGFQSQFRATDCPSIGLSSPPLPIPIRQCPIFIRRR